MINRMKNDKIFCGLDIGSDGIKAALVQAKERDQLELLGAYQMKTHGYKKNSVTNLNEFSECIQYTLSQLSEKSGEKIKDVYVGLGGECVEVRPSSTMIPLVERGSKVIHERDLRKINEQARLLGVKMEEETLHDLPQSYIVDDVNSVINPVGLYGRKLGVNALMIVTAANRIRNINKAITHAGFDVSGVYFGSYVAHRIATTHDQRMAGCMLMDFGADLTQIFIFKDGVLKFYHKIDIGAHDMTQTISDKLNIPTDLAEEIKQSYADVAKGRFLAEEEILVKKENNYLPIQRQTIYDAVEPVTESLLSQIKNAYLTSGCANTIQKGAVVIGGGALLPGLIERIDKEVIQPVQLGKADSLLQKNISHGSIFINAISLAVQGVENQFGKETSSSDDNWVQLFVNKVREIYQEYF